MWYLLLCTCVSAFHLFDGPSALSWDADELARVRDLHKRTFNDPQNFNTSLSSYLGLSFIHGVHLPISVNVILLGFDGHGKGKVNMTAEDLQKWFEATDHVIPHTRVPLNELSCKEDGYCLDFERVRKPEPLHSYVHYNLSVQVFEVPSDLSAEFARMLEALMRPGEDRRQQIDVTGLEGVVDGMLATMGVLWGYNILLINPSITQPYVYRSGFSKGEIDALTDDEVKLQGLREMAKKYQDRSPLPPGHDLVDRSRHRILKPTKSDAQWFKYESGMWTRQIRSWLSQRRRLLDSLPKTMTLKEAVLMKGIHGDGSAMELLDVLKQNAVHRSDLKGVGGMRVREPEEGCPLDIWAGHRRWILIDLAATPQDWGPFVGGDGVKTESTLPYVQSYFTKSKKSDPNLKSTELKEKLITQREKHLEELHAYRVEGYVPKDVLRAAEDDLLNRFHAQHCLHAQHPMPLCQRIEEVRLKLANKEDVFLSEGGDDQFIAWLGMDEDTDEGELEHEVRTRDLFLAHAASVVSRAIRHTFIPPTLTWRHPSEVSLDQSMPFAKRVTFRMYLVTDPVRNSKNAHIPFDTVAFKSELMGLKLDGQGFTFTVRHLNLLDDPLLSTALAASLRSSSVEQMGSPTDVFAEERLYFDAAELETLLSKRLFADGGPQKRTVSEKETHLEVPIFILMLDRDRPIFIDRHYIARALEHMVIVVHNGQHRGQHPLGIICEAATAGQTLAAPLKAALGAVLQHLGGVLPSHLGYSPDHRAVAHDWAWSVGANPFSLTSPGWKISQAQKDALHRTYLLDTIDLSIHRVNWGISNLRLVRNMSGTFQYVQSQGPQLVQLLKDYSTLVELWRRVLNDANKMDFSRATARLNMIESTTSEFVNAAVSIAEGAKPVACREAHAPFLGIEWLTQEIMGGALLLTICLVIYKALPKKRKQRND